MEHRQIREKRKTHKKKWCLREQLEVGVWLLFMLHHQIEVLRSFVLLHYSPSARLADRILMIHELRGSNQTHATSFTSSAHLLWVYSSRVSISALSFQLCFDTHLHTDTGTFLPHSTLAFCYPPKKDRVVFGSTPEFGGHFGKWNAWLLFYTREQMPRDWLKACICTILENFHRKKRISSGFVVVFLLSRFMAGVCLFWTCLERETDTIISYSDFAQQGGPWEREALITS